MRRDVRNVGVTLRVMSRRFRKMSIFKMVRRVKRSARHAERDGYVHGFAARCLSNQSANRLTSWPSVDQP